MNEYRIFGPPGTGKTTLLATKEIPEAVEKFGSDKIMVTSFSKAAALEIASRLSSAGSLVDDRNVGTIHSICYRALGHPEMVAKKLKQWNETYPQFQIDGSAMGSLDEAVSVGSTAKLGNNLLATMDIKRAKMVPKDRWAPTLIDFYRKWTNFKVDTGTIDFTDMVEICLREIDTAPGEPMVLFNDETQDATPMMLALCRKWGQHMDKIVLAGDDDQCVYRFCGTSPEAFLNPPIDEKFKHVLRQSYRVPRAVHMAAMDIITKVSRRELKDYKPRDYDGSLRIIKGRNRPATFGNPNEVVEDALTKYKKGKSVMFLASCSYMLEPVKKVLMHNGIPFGNSYRETRGDWNPLAPGREGKVSASDLVNNFIATGPDEKYWTVQQFVTWAKYLAVNDSALIRVKGRKVLDALEKALVDNQEGLFSVRNVIGQVLNESVVERALERNTGWLIENLKTARAKSAEYPIRVFKNFGEQGLKKKPFITLGTIHSVKGGESDCVYIWPDIAYSAYSEIWARNKSLLSLDAWEDLHRLFYVALTRAKEEVALLPPLEYKHSVQDRLYFSMQDLVEKQKEAA